MTVSKHMFSHSFVIGEGRTSTQCLMITWLTFISSLHIQCSERLKFLFQILGHTIANIYFVNLLHQIQLKS